jgi:disulfide bond formation protein DsbB
MGFWFEKEYYLASSYVLMMTLLGIVFVLEYGFGILPCKLCLLQRYPYYLMFIVLGIYHLVLLGRTKAFDVYVLYVVLMCFAVAAVLAFYHSLIEFGYVAVEFDCASSETYTDLNRLREAIISRPAVSCDVAAIKFLFLSLSNWNFIIALAGVIGGSVTISRLEKI